MSNYRLSPAAQRDLHDIWDYTSETWDATQAEIYTIEIRDAIERIAAQPARGRAVDQLRPGYRRYAVERHVIFYVERHDAIEVIRILHQRMDPTRHV